MSKTAFYQTDFKPDYQLFQQKISQLSAQKSRIVKKQVNLEKLQHQLELIKQQIDDQGLEYDQNSIFVRYASIQQLSHKKKTASDCCVHCGQEMKKNIQCEICAEVYCKNCCWRKRVIPFQQHQDFRLCCEQCHQKYIKHFNNEQFYKQKGIYLAAIDELERKYEKTKAKYEKKEGEVNQYKEQKRTAKIREGNLKKAVLEEEKRIKQLSQEFQRAVKEKALRMKEQEQQRKLQSLQQQDEKEKQELKKKQQEQKRTCQLQQEQKKLQEAARLRDEQLARRQAQIQREKQLLQKERKQLSQSRLRQLEQLQIKTIQQKPQIKTQTLQSQTFQQSRIQQQAQQKLPRQVVSLEEIDIDSILNQNNLKTQNQQKSNEYNQHQHSLQQLEQQGKPSHSQSKPQQYIQKQHSQKQQQSNQQKKQHSQQKPSLKQLLNQIKLNKKPQDHQQKPTSNLSKSEVSLNQKSIQKQQNEAPRLTMTQIKTMSINDLLSMKIPMNPSAHKEKKPRKSSHPQINVEAEQNSTTTQNQKMYQSLLQPGIPQQSFFVGLAIPNDLGKENDNQQQNMENFIQPVQQQQEDMDQREKEVHKNALLRRESLISSAHKVSVASQRTPNYNEEQETVGEPQKCTCEIM